jgi:hypothetical protein
MKADEPLSPMAKVSCDKDDLTIYDVERGILTGDFAMASDLCFYELVLFGLLWLCVMLHYVWPSDCATGDRTTPTPATPPRKRPRDLKPYTKIPIFSPHVRVFYLPL